MIKIKLKYYFIVFIAIVLVGGIYFISKNKFQTEFNQSANKAVEKETEQPETIKPKDISLVMKCNKVTSKSLNEYKNAICQSKKSLIYITSSGCGYCLKMNPIVEEVVAKNNLNIIKVDLQSLNQKDIQELFESNDFFTYESWGTPLFLVVEDQKIINKLIGYREKVDFLIFLKESEIINE